jgi:hypothetical protein
MFILEYYFASKSFDAVHEAFSNACPVRKVLNKTTYQLLIKFRDTLTFYNRRRVQRRRVARGSALCNAEETSGRWPWESLRRLSQQTDYLCNSCGLDCVLHDTPYINQPFATYLS